jgi:hypothetical protein
MPLAVHKHRESSTAEARRRNLVPGAQLREALGVEVRAPEIRRSTYALIAVVVAATACSSDGDNGGEAIRTGTTSAAASVTTTSTDGGLPPLQAGDEAVELGSGVTFRVPKGWESEAYPGLAQAGLPANREFDYSNVLVASYVVNGQGEIIRLPANWRNWIRSRRDLTVRDADPIRVDGKSGTITHIAGKDDEISLFCVTDLPRFCFVPGRSGVDYGMVELETNKLLIIEGPSPARVRELAQFVELS